MSESKKMSRKMRLAITSMTIGMYIAYVVLLFWYHPFVVSAKEGESIPGGVGNTVTVSSVTKMIGKDWIVEDRFTLVAADGWEILACYDDKKIQIGYTAWNPSTSDYNGINVVNIKDCTGYFINKKDGDILQSWTYSYEKGEFPALTYCATDRDDRTIAFEITGCKLFESTDAMKDYINTGSLDGMIKEPVLDKDWFLKNVGCIVTADDSPSSEAGEDATYVTFTWDTDNLQDGDLLEIKTHNYYKSLNGEEHGGFYDYITQGNNVSAYDGKYGPFSQYEATKAWYKSLDYHPLFFKSYDTDIYFLRPIRNGKVGGWVKVFMKRNSLTNGSPYIEKVEYGNLDKEGNWTVNKDLTDKEGGYGVDQNGNKIYPDTDNLFEGTNISGIFKSFFDFFKDIPSLLSDLPGLVNSTIGFLPNWVIGFIAIGIIVVIILRIVGR